MRIRVDSIRASLMTVQRVVVVQVTSLSENTKWIKWFDNNEEKWVRLDPDESGEYYPLWIDVPLTRIHIIKAMDCFGNEASIQIDDEYISELYSQNKKK